MSWRRWVHACAATADVAALAAGVGLATTALLWTVSWWSHHFQPVGLAFSLLLIPPVAFFQRVQLPGSALLRTIARALGILVIVGAGVLVARVPLYARFSTQELLYRPVNECQLFATIAQPWMVTQECLVTQETFAPGTRISTLPENGRGTLLAWTPPDIVVACRVFYQFPWFRPELLQEALDCLKSPEVDVVLRIPYWFPFSSFEQQTHDILDERFQLSRRDGVIEVWERRR